jgi:hypothetical protein
MTKFSKSIPLILVGSAVVASGLGIALVRRGFRTWKDCCNLSSQNAPDIGAFDILI